MAGIEHRTDAMPEALYAASLDCVRCGLCQSSCPTYLATGRESASPRGRVALMRGVAEGAIPLSGLISDEAALCLGCRACESACPSGVRFGAMLEHTRARLVEAGLRDSPAARLERLLLRHLIPHRHRLHAALGMLRLASLLQLDAAIRRFWPGSRAALLPALPPRRLRRPLPAFTPARGGRRGRVALLEGCVMPELFGDVNRATLRLLSHNGFDVIVPAGQTCCGALHAHAGDLESARRLARRNASVFAGQAVDAVISNSAGCGAAMREAEAWIGAEGRAYARSVRDVTEFLDARGLRPPGGRCDAIVCYDDPCHLAHAQQVRAAPRRLLEQVPGLKLRPHRDPEACCGAAGTYNLTQPEMSRHVLDRKLDALAAADPDLIATGNPGCLLQLRAGVRRRGLRARLLHPVQILAAAYEAPEGSGDVG